MLSAEPLNGYQVIQQIADRTGGAWRPSPGSVYPTIAQLEDEAWWRAPSPAGGGVPTG
ncbi:MAG: helix-turn-helix transcriptional regulator [Nocardioides sp.]